MNTDRRTPVVFVSSTCYDLKQVREDLKDFFEIIMVFKLCCLSLTHFLLTPVLVLCYENKNRSQDLNLDNKCFQQL